MAVGVTLVFGIMRVINLAHGSCSCSALLPDGLADLDAVLCARHSLGLHRRRAGAVVLEMWSCGRSTGRGPSTGAATFGLSLFFNEAVTVIWGRESIPLSIPPFLTARSRFIPAAPIRSSSRHHRVAILAGLLLYLLITRTRVGALIRAGSDNARSLRARDQYQPALHAHLRAQAMLAALAGIMMARCCRWSREPATRSSF